MPFINLSDNTHTTKRQVFSATSMLCKPFVGRWCDLRGFREVYLLTIAISIVGNLLCGYYVERRRERDEKERERKREREREREKRER